MWQWGYLCEQPEANVLTLCFLAKKKNVQTDFSRTNHLLTYYLFNIFAATLHVGGRSSIRNLRTRHAVVTGTHLHGEQITDILNSAGKVALNEQRSIQ
jgi:hypothetical protein